MIPPINAPSSSLSQSLNSRRDSVGSSSVSEPLPKRLRLEDEASTVDSEAQHSIKINNVINALVKEDQLENAQQPRRTAEIL